MDDAAPPLDQAILKQYIKYARAFVKPILREVDSEKVSSCPIEVPPFDRPR